ncbi:NACHT domain-containing protein [Actinoplanes palleronii]|uniref:NACHT domain-containing protein n=1 Tax=Actinoplanes palleronii TaxID=113570 RepID=A0ABQ4BMD8_9ACTN|nr:NACHT domain-containing protein [Actinoplanes palleronii]GIE71842.1 hypothetical protein Apa02nite_079500 [Actinoplanes palleronii]
MYPTQIGDNNEQNNNTFNIAPSVYEQALDHLRSMGVEVAAEQVTSLTPLGALIVPWEHPDAPALVDENDLSCFVAEGGRLLILGASQSGKTTLASQLVQLIGERTDRQVVLFPLTAWDVARVSLKDWLADHLRTGLLHGREEGDVATWSLADSKILPVFDGFDEIDPGFRDRAAAAIRHYLNAKHLPAVLTSIPPHGGAASPEAALDRAAVITLTAVGAAEVGRYLLEDAPPETIAGWHVVAERMTTDPTSPVSVALSSPLMAWLAKSIYVAPRDPADLVALFTTPEQLEEHLLSRLVDAVFDKQDANPHDGSPARTFTRRDARRWLRFLAVHADRNIVAFWELPRYTPARAAGLTLSVLAGAFFGWFARTVPAVAAPVFYLLLTGLFFGYTFARGYSSGRAAGGDDPRRHGYVIRSLAAGRPTDGSAGEHIRSLAKGVLLASITYGTAVLVGAGWRWGQPVASFWAGLAMATGLATLAGILGGRVAAVWLRQDTKLDSGTGARAGDPVLAISNDRRSGGGMAKLALVLFTLGYLIYWWFWLPPVALSGLVAVPIAVMITLLCWNTWTRYICALLWLSVRGRLPWRMPDFLHACHSGGLLRRSGNYFEFRHRRLRAQLSLVDTNDR